MKPIPASATQRPTWSGVRSILTPREESTSAAPEREDSARLPCLATGTPAPATMKAAQVETLTEPEPSPPVPTTSTASGGASTRNILARMADTAPVISSTVSPRTRKAINSPPICDGVASPDIMLSNADAASSRVSVAPVATLPMIDLKSSIIRVLSNCSVAVGARDLGKGGLVDRCADILLEAGDVFGDLFLGHGLLQALLALLYIRGIKINRRHVVTSDAEHDPFVVAAALALPDITFGSAESRGDDARGQPWHGAASLQSLRRFDFHSDARSFVGQIPGRAKLPRDIGSLGPQSALDLVFAPARRDLVLDFVERAAARWGDAQDVVPDIAVLVSDRIVVDADVTVEGLLDHVETGRNVGGLAVGQMTRMIDRVDRGGSEPELLCRLNDAGAAGALVLHLVAEVRNLTASSFGRDRLL